MRVLDFILIIAIAATWWAFAGLTLLVTKPRGRGTASTVDDGKPIPIRWLPRKPLYRSEMDPLYPCRKMPTRHCPVAYEGVCGERPCARYESDDQSPWLPELEPGVRAQVLKDMGEAFPDGD